VKPPTLRELMGDPIYSKFIRTIPRLPENLRWGRPWAVYQLHTDGRWFGGNFSDYRAAWAIVVGALKNHDIEDVAIVSRRLLVPRVPSGYQIPWGLDWCTRCRRPTTWAIRAPRGGYRALATTDDPYRCYYCRARASLAAIDPRSYYVDTSV
jgi:hypothetical protein